MWLSAEHAKIYLLRCSNKSLLLLLAQVLSRSRTELFFVHNRNWLAFPETWGAQYSDSRVFKLHSKHILGEVHHPKPFPTSQYPG